MLQETLKSIGEQTAALFDVQFYPGGAKSIKQDAVIYSRDDPSPIFIILDGDEAPEAPFFDPDSMSVKEREDLDASKKKLDEEISKQTGTKIDFNTDGGTSGGDKKQAVELRCKYLKYYRRNVFYLPFDSPEEEIWDDDRVEKLLEVMFSGQKLLQAKEKVANAASPKQKFAILAEVATNSGGGMPIKVFHNFFLNAWINTKSDSYEDLCNLILSIKNLPA